jgi:hypothetical protein
MTYPKRPTTGAQFAKAAQERARFVDGSLDEKTIVDRAFKTYVLENRYLTSAFVRRRGRTSSDEMQ